MAYKLRLTAIEPHDYLNPDAQVSAQIEAFDVTTGRVIAKGNLVYSGDALNKMTAAEVRRRLRTDALAWAASVKEAATASPEVAKNLTTMSRLQALVGAEIDIV